MNTYLLTTKLQIPPQPHHLVPRARLVGLLEEKISQYKLVVVSAPVGYGKTTLLSQWAHASLFPVAWLSLGAEDNDPERFLRYLLMAWEGHQPGVKESVAGVLLGATRPDMEAVLTAFVNLANAMPGHMVFVLNDWHLIDDPATHQALTFLLDHMPPAIHFVLATRAAPGLPMARYRARHELLELRAEDLRFLPEETTDFLNERMRLDLPEGDVVRLHAQLEGWIAGLQLAALTLQRRAISGDEPLSSGEQGQDTAKLAVSGRHRYIADYLSEEILASLSEDTRRFLLQTSILHSLCGSLCDAVTGAAGGQQMLERLERENLFLVPLDDNREWFRYHRLFADFLHDVLNRQHPGEVADLRRRAARWYLAHEMPEQALQLAVAATDAEIAVKVFDMYSNPKLYAGELGVVKRWLESLPEQWQFTYPALGIAQAGVLAFTGALEACVRRLGEVEQSLEPGAGEQARTQLAKVSAVRCTIACMKNDLAQAEAYAGKALQDLPVDDDTSLHMVYGALGDAYRHVGRWEEAKQYYLKVLDLPYGPKYRIHSVHVLGALADLELRQGRLRNAAAYWTKALAGIQDQANWGAFPLPLIGWVYIRMGEILYEYNELEEAADYVSRGLQRVELGGDARAMIAGYLIAGRLGLTQGDIAAAGEFLGRARPLVEDAPFPDWVGRFKRFEVELWLAQDKVRSAAAWANELLHAGDEHLQSPEVQLALARVLVVKGDAPPVERALDLLDRLLWTADAEGRMVITVEALALQALAHWRHGDHSSALTSLERALRTAEPEGYVRLFADLGLPMARLLQVARSRDVMPDYVDRLLAALGAAPSPGTHEGSPSAADKALPEPLSPREQELLRLVAAGLTNREIAIRTVISPETVKKHVANICDKLGVRNRTEAAARARELGLLDSNA
jgi:LuxR family maltose regulon positive regulatory protein